MSCFVSAERFRAPEEAPEAPGGRMVSTWQVGLEGVDKAQLETMKKWRKRLEHAKEPLRP